VSKKNRIPKTIAGVKVPKVLRKNSLIKGLLGSATGRTVIAEALMAGAAAGAAVLAGNSKGMAKAGAAVSQVTEDGADIARRALKSAVNALTERGKVGFRQSTGR